ASSRLPRPCASSCKARGWDTSECNNRGGKDSGSMSSAGLEAEVGDCAVAAKTTPGIHDSLVKEELQEQEQEEHHQKERARPGKRMRKLGGMAQALQRHSAWTAGSRLSNNAESPTSASSKRQRKSSARVPAQQCWGDGTATPYKPRQRYCQEDGCTTWPSYGDVRNKKAEFCSKHSKPGMINVVSTRCGHPRCMKQPSYGNHGMKPEFCSQHSQQGMVDIVNPRCGHPGCTKQ
ncbi:unnamed protein product, partial [Ectocarpus sp. 8 AP-2014]